MRRTEAAESFLRTVLGTEAGKDSRPQLAGGDSSGFAAIGKSRPEMESAFETFRATGQSNVMFLESNNRSLHLHFVCLFNFTFLINQNR